MKEYSIKVLGKANYDQVKGLLKRVPGEQIVSGIMHNMIQIRELSGLIKENKIVTFPPYSSIAKDCASTHEIIHEVVKEWLDLYGIVRLGRRTAAAIDSSKGGILLYTPQALLEIPSTYEEYLTGIRCQTRRLIRVAEKQGYEFKEFVWNDYLDNIFEINTSKEIRQSEPMRGWYREPVQPRYHSKEELQYRKYYGAFKDGKLYAYFHFYMCGNFAIGKHILGHAQHLKYGIMNALISWTVRECIENFQTRWLHYGRFEKGSLGQFKKRAGFQMYSILLDLEADQELLEYSKHKVRTIWRP